MSVLDNFQEWKNFLAERVDQAKGMGMDANTISDLAYQLGDYLAKDIDPQNDQERLLKDLWSVADENEQRVMAGLMVKLVDDGKK
ncbi:MULTISPECIES: DUF3243 domain-containing protein [unclassified Thermoactinomyces]|jgi:hypothetical protein|uniref:DUF3243 domain-containing protein n=1 Tax=unclassified Thermoactinomyces TaxID=2634588 RepID=UPI0018DE9CDE|nr:MULTISPECIES: DUF3243 domain-containing protein [unclassified Thermoactinomyces]MBH8598294.1 DUF3243 domain-containing protein [Thermoactinomyces sp. CICC 10523]MBH8604417.1 DUF3243 domain-containing protein [Thermoactinomyces sp. CICC 10522]MBH8608468.1 DUF3243 domain-containing protein [Thermoactinomyces sp. CICC 10521]